MTTIAYKDRVMAADSRETSICDGESPMVLNDDCTKIFKLSDGSLFGASRGSEEIERLHQSLVDNLPPPKLEDINGLLVKPDETIWLYEGNIWQKIRQTYYAVGSGSLFAFAAMDAGASAIEAAEIGAKRDPYSGGKVIHLRLRSKKKDPDA